MVINVVYSLFLVNIVLKLKPFATLVNVIVFLIEYSFHVGVRFCVVLCGMIMLCRLRTSFLKSHLMSMWWLLYSMESVRNGKVFLLLSANHNYTVYFWQYKDGYTLNFYILFHVGEYTVQSDKLATRFFLNEEIDEVNELRRW